MNIKLSCNDVAFWASFSDEEFLAELKDFNQKYADESFFGDIDVATRQALCRLFLDHFGEASSQLQCAIITMIRLVARDKSNIEVLITAEICSLLWKAARLREGTHFQDTDVLLEAQMCLINILFQSSFARRIFLESSCDSKLIERIWLLNGGIMSKEQKEECQINPSDLSVEVVERIRLYDLRIAFITTAYSLQLQERWLREGHEACFIALVEEILPKRESLQLNLGDACKSAFSAKHDEECANEALKILFNLYSHATPQMANQLNCASCLSVCSKVLLKLNSNNRYKQGALNLLTVVPHSLTFLLKGVENCKGDKLLNMEILDVLLLTLDEYLSATGSEGESLLSSCLTVLIGFCTDSAEARRYVRLKVMPPLRAEDVQERPDVGRKMRNKLVKVMTGDMYISQLAAHFLFILCKRSVSRFNKYCGFGNAAGLLANYGLLGEINLRKNTDDSEDSETEDYKNVEERVNAVTGCIEPERENPFANMSDEQKEYEAMKLVNAMKNLMDQGVISPAKTDENGKLRPVKHILEIAEDHTKKKTSVDHESDED